MNMNKNIIKWVLQIFCIFAVVSCDKDRYDTRNDLNSYLEKVTEKAVSLPVTCLEKALELDHYLSLDEVERNSSKYSDITLNLRKDRNTIVWSGVGKFVAKGSLRKAGSVWIVKLNNFSLSYRLSKQQEDSLWKATCINKGDDARPDKIEVETMLRMMKSTLDSENMNNWTISARAHTEGERGYASDYVAGNIIINWEYIKATGSDTVFDSWMIMYGMAELRTFYKGKALDTVDKKYKWDKVFTWR